MRGSGESNVMEYTYEPRPWCEPVASMWVTCDGRRLWVRRGDVQGFVFDVYSVVDGRQVYSVRVSPRGDPAWKTTFFVSDSSSLYALLEDEGATQVLVRVLGSS